MKHLKFLTHGLLIICTATSITLSAQTSIRGKVIGKSTNATIPIAKIELYKDGNLISTTHSDLYGNYSFTNLSEGKYDLEGHSIGHITRRALNVGLENSMNAVVNLSLATNDRAMDQVCIVRYKYPTKKPYRAP